MTSSPSLVLKRCVCASPPLHALNPRYLQVKYLDENLGALNVKLTKEELAQIRDLIEKSNATKGDRYPAWGMGLAYADTPELKA